MKFEIIADIFSRKLRNKDCDYIRDILTNSLKIGASTKTFSKCIYDINKEDKIFNEEEYLTIEKIFNFKLETNDIELFFAVPLMASKSFLSYDNMISVFEKNNVREIIVEEKYDGERIQVF